MHGLSNHVRSCSVCDFSILALPVFGRSPGQSQAQNKGTQSFFRLQEKRVLIDSLRQAKPAWNSGPLSVGGAREFTRNRIFLTPDL